MKLLLALSFRNLWRNKKRTWITVASIAFALFFALLMRSMQNGCYRHMVKNMVQMHTGYLQIHARGYWDDPSLEKSFKISDDLISSFKSEAGIQQVLPRLECFSLCSSGIRTKGAYILGMDPFKENLMTDLKAKLISGSYLSAQSKGVLLSEGLAKYFRIHVGDTLVLLGSGYHGMSAAGKYEVQGIVKLPSPELNRQMLYMPLLEAQDLFSCTGRLTALVFMLSDGAGVYSLRDSLQKKWNTKYEVMDWPSLLPDLVQAIEVDSAGGLIMLSILYLVVGFSILGTVMMMTSERRKEFGTLIAIGMKRWKLGVVVFLETVSMAFLGIALGGIVNFPFILYLFFHPIRLTGRAALSIQNFGLEPILPCALDFHIFLSQASVVFTITLLTVLYPLRRIASMDLPTALKS